MIDFKNEHADTGAENGPIHPLKLLSERQFAALGGDHVVFVRTISAGDLAALVPEAAHMPEETEFHLVMAANGAPMMVSDNEQSLNEWISEQSVEVALRH